MPYNYWKISSLPVKTLTHLSCISLVCCGLFPGEKKGVKGEQEEQLTCLYIDQHKESKARRRNVVMAWINDKKKGIWYVSLKLGCRLSENVLIYPTKL